MPVSETFRNLVFDQFSPLVRGLRFRNMFGGVGIYGGELFFALLAEDRLYLKVDDSNRGQFEAMGMQPFRPFGHDTVVLQYYELPLELIETGQLLSPWVVQALAVPQAAKQSKPRKKVALLPKQRLQKMSKKTIAKKVLKKSKPTKLKIKPKAHK